MDEADQQEAELRWRRDPDVRLMLRVRDGDRAAFETLVLKYQDRIVGLLHHMLGRAADAEDLAQDVFLRIYRNRAEYVPRAKFSTWLFTIVHNLALNAIRNQKRKRKEDVNAGTGSGPLGPRPLEQLVLAPSGSMPNRVFAKSELAEIVRAAVQQLSEEQRLAVMLNKFEDMSYRDIAEVMGKSEMAVKSLLSRARTVLRDLLSPYLAEGQRP